MRKWHHYLLGHLFVIKTDQKALKFLLEEQQLGVDQQKWVSKLLGYKFKIQYKHGKENRVSDALSRRKKLWILSPYLFGNMKTSTIGKKLKMMRSCMLFGKKMSHISSHLKVILSKMGAYSIMTSWFYQETPQGFHY